MDEELRRTGLPDLRFDDMTIVGSPSPALAAALRTVASNLHPEFNKVPKLARDASKRSCVLSSLAVRDFLFRRGFRDVEVRSVKIAMKSETDGVVTRSLGVGFPPDEPRPGMWSGHMVVSLPSEGYIVDTTLYPAMRPHWASLTGMMAVPVIDDGPEIYGYKALSGFAISAPPSKDLFTVAWLDDPANKVWRDSPDARGRWRRDGVVAALLALHSGD